MVTLRHGIQFLLVFNSIFHSLALLEFSNVSGVRYSWNARCAVEVNTEDLLFFPHVLKCVPHVQHAYFSSFNQ